MRLRSDSTKILWLLASAATLVLTMLALGGYSGAQVHAGSADLSGTWDIRYLLSCSASLTQTGSDISGTFECGDFGGTLDGTYTDASGELSLTGSVEGGVPFVAEGAVEGTGRSMAGSFTAPPYVPDGRFEGERRGAADTSDLTGEWTLVIEGVFSGMCTADVTHRGAAVDVSSDCGPVAALEGTSSNGEIALQGVLFMQALIIQGTVSDDGRSIEGTWLVPDLAPPLAGVFLADRIDGPPPTAEHDDTPAPVRTATPVIPALPGTGVGPGDSEGVSLWIYIAMAVGGAALLVAGQAWLRGKG